MHRPSRLVPPFLLLVAACASDRASNDVVHLIRAERYAEAVELAADRAEKAPGDESARLLHRDATVAYLLAQGRAALFDRRLEDALDAFNQALVLSPENPAVRQWIVRAREELTRRWLDVGRDHLLADEFDPALEAYQLALYYTPGHPEALFGASRVLFLINYRAGLGEDYYNQGIRAVHEHLLRQARSKFWNSAKYKADGKAEERREQVESALAEERLFRGAAFEEEGLYGAALTEYRVVLLFEPENQRALDGAERMKSELEAKRVLAEADKLIRQGRFQEALVALEEGRSLTRLQTERFSNLVNEIEIAHWEALYQRARDEERDFRYETAIATYDELLGLTESYADVAERRRTLADYVRRAGELYAQLDETEGPEEELALLREIELLWPEYQDIQARIHALEQQLKQP